MGKDQLRLTPTEEQVMLRLWQLQKAAVAEILELYPEPKPAYNTVSTIVRILEKKKFIRHKQQGRGYVYTPRISKEEYRNSLANHLIEHYFERLVFEFDNLIRSGVSEAKAIEAYKPIFNNLINTTVDDLLNGIIKL